MEGSPPDPPEWVIFGASVRFSDVSDAEYLKLLAAEHVAGGESSTCGLPRLGPARSAAQRPEGPGPHAQLRQPAFSTLR